MFLLGQIKNECVIGLGQGKDFGKCEFFKPRYLQALALSKEVISLGKEKGLPLTCGPVSRLFCL